MHFKKHYYSSLQCHMILQKLFWYAAQENILLLLLLSELKTVALLNIFLETYDKKKKNLISD